MRSNPRPALFALVLAASLLAPSVARANARSCTAQVPNAAGREDTIEIFGFSHEITSPRDAASGLPTGKRQHKPFTVIKAVDAATPHLFQMLSSGETTSSVRITCRRVPAKKGDPSSIQTYSVELEQAKVVDIRTETVGERSENLPHQAREHVSFTYQKITWTWHSADQDYSKTTEVDEAGYEI
jgi:type VI secretion system secreted protein Hcp